VNGGWGVPSGENKWLIGIGGVAFGDSWTTHYHFNIHNNTCWFFPALVKDVGTSVVGKSLLAPYLHWFQLDCDVKVIWVKEEKHITRTLSLVVHRLRFFFKNLQKSTLAFNRKPSILVVNWVSSCLFPFSWVERLHCCYIYFHCS
jgi:hypothetical protein